MQKLNAELGRLYLADPAAPTGQVRAIALVFQRRQDDGESGHWERLCAVANRLQADLGLPAPAVSISGAHAFGLWLSLETPAPLAQLQEFAVLLDADASAPASQATPLPPALNPASGKWAAFINPGMGASFAGDEGLDIEPPEAGQLALLEGLQSMSAAQFAQALDQLRQSARAAPPAAHAADKHERERPGEGLLLRDATLEDIVRHLQSKNIEPTFRFLSPPHHR